MRIIFRRKIPYVVKQPKRPRYVLNSGITLIEVMLIIMLLILLTSALIPLIFYTNESPPVNAKEHQDILLIKNALNFYKLDNGFYPTTAQGINALIKKPHSPPVPLHWTPYLTELPLDRWGRSYQYKNNASIIEIFSCGPPLTEQNWWQKIIHRFSNQPCTNDLFKDN